MEAFISLWRQEPGARRFFFALAQGALGTAAAYVGVMVVAYERLGSAWAASLILLADILPAMLLSPLIGAWLDRRDRLRSAVSADALRAAALLGMVVLPGALPLLGCALLAGIGTTVFRPAVFGLLPAAVHQERRMAALSLWGAVQDAGMTLGPAVAAGVIVLGGASLLLCLNAAAYAGCALLLAGVKLASVPERDEADDESLAAGAREGLRFLLGDGILRVLFLGTGAIVLCSGMMNVAEVLLAQKDLAVGGAGFAGMVAVFGVGMVCGSTLSASSEGLRRLKAGYLLGLTGLGLGLVGSALAPSLPFALVSFFCTGLASSVATTHDRGLVQHLVPQRMLSRAHSLLGTVEAWGFAGAALLGGAAASLWGARGVFALAGGAILLIAAVAAFTLTRPRAVQAPVPATA
jgi:MFS family permease